nr:thiamine phosphate synthase [Nitrospinaceae bacterium]
PDALIGVSTHSLAEIDAASQAGADFVTFGPVYPTPAKIDLGEPVGLEALRAACDRSPIPVFALGGVTADRLSELRSSGCSRFSCIGAILHAENPETATRAILAAE